MKSLFALEIPSNAYRDHYLHELEKEFQAHIDMEQARDKWLKGKIPIDEFLVRLEQLNVNIDSYLRIVEDNLRFVGIL